jgi:hypothetical protein
MTMQPQDSARREVGHKLSGHGFYLIVSHSCVGKPPEKKKKTSPIPGVSLEKHHWKLFGIAVLILICSSSPFYSGRLQVLCSIRSLLGFHRPAGSNSTDIMNLIFSYVILSLSGIKLRTYYSVLTRRHSAALPQAHRHQGPSFYSTRESVRYT